MKKEILSYSLVLVISLLSLISCNVTSENVVFKKEQVYKNVDAVFEFTKAESKELLSEQYSFIYFKYTLKNRNTGKLYFHPGEIQVIYNGITNTSTEYDSIASAETESITLLKGTHEYLLILVFKNKNIEIKISEFKVLNSGISDKRKKDK